MKAGVYGYGFVGRATHGHLAAFDEVVIHDPVSHPDPVTGLDVAFICVPTPQGADGQCDTSIVETVARETDAPLIVVRSTVPPGTCDRIADETGKRVVFLPEFIVERTGTDPSDGYWIIGGEDISAMLPPRELIVVARREAEAVKYLLNSFFALKVTFAYEFAGMCHAMGIDYNAVLSTAATDPRFDPDHMAIIGSPGFGGKCLPKDTAAIVRAAREAGSPLSVLEMALLVNSRWRG